MIRRERAVAAVLVFALLPSLAALRSRVFFSPDETYYTEVAREMAQSGDLVVPRFDGHPFLEKPPLVYWLLAGAFGLLGWGFPAAVLLNSLLTAATALLLLAHVRRAATPRAGLIAAIAYLTMLLPGAAARTALTDPALTLCTTAALAAFLLGTGGGALAAGLALGLGVLAKGPIAPLVVGPALALSLLVERNRRAAWRVVVTLAVGAAVALPWHLTLASRGLLGEYLRVFVGQQVVSRAVDTWRQQGPWWYYLPVLWAALFPWGSHMLAAARRTWRDLPRGGAANLAPAAWAVTGVVPLAALSLATNKFPHYVLPLLPWFAAALGRAADHRLADAAEAGRGRWVGPVAGLLNGGALVAATVMLERSRFAAIASPSWVPALLVAAAALALLGFLEVRNPARAWFLIGLVALGLHAAADAVAIPRLASRLVERPLADRVRAALPAGGLPVAHRWFRPSLVTYGVRGWRVTADAGELGRVLDEAARQGRAALVATRDDYEGEARAAAWNDGGAAALLGRVRGLGELDGEAIGAVVFAVSTVRDGRRFFYDADRPLAGVTGFAGQEGNRWTPSFRWSVEPEATVTADVDPGGPARVFLRAWGAPVAGGSQRVAVRLNGAPLGELTLGRFPTVARLDVPPADLRPGGPQELRFTTATLVRPRDVDAASGDTRALGFALDWVAIEPATEDLDLVRPER